MTQDVAVHAEEWNLLSEGGPDFYTAHLMPPEPQPSLASMQQGDTTSCLNTMHPQRLKLLLTRVPHFGLKSCLHMSLHVLAILSLSWQRSYNLPAQHHMFCVPQSFYM